MLQAMLLSPAVYPLAQTASRPVLPLLQLVRLKICVSASISLSISLPLCCKTTLNHFRVLLDWIEPDGLGSYGFGPYGFGPYGFGPEGFGADCFGPEGFGPDGFGHR